MLRAGYFDVPHFYSNFTVAVRKGCYGARASSGAHVTREASAPQLSHDVRIASAQELDQPADLVTGLSPESGENRGEPLRSRCWIPSPDKIARVESAGSPLTFSMVAAH
ncbi:hypothetical protein ABIC02_007458 [Bradyrhizobium sp. RT5a]